jgi:hypothetical protein
MAKAGKKTSSKKPPKKPPKKPGKPVVRKADKRTPKAKAPAKRKPLPRAKPRVVKKVRVAMKKAALKPKRAARPAPSLKALNPEPAPQQKPETLPKQETAPNIRPEQPPSPAQAPEKIEIRPEPQPLPPHLDASPSGDSPVPIPLVPALDLLPEWEDRLRLKRAIFEDGLQFFSLGRKCPEMKEASALLGASAKKASDHVPGYFVVCLKDRAGKMVGAMDGHMLDGGMMHIGRSAVKDDKRREFHILLYSAALSGHSPTHVVCVLPKSLVSIGFAGILILFGRGFGFSALPAQLPDSIIALRRVRNELDPISSGKEVAGALAAARPVFGNRFDAIAAEMSQKGVVPLVPLPFSPDSREHLHELRDVVTALGINPNGLDVVVEQLRVEYVLGRKDITPESF